MTFLAGVDENETKCKAAKHDEHCRRQRVLNAIFKFKRLQHERQHDPHSDNKDPEDCRVGSGQEQGGRLLLGAGGTQDGRCRNRQSKPSSMVRKLLSAPASTGPTFLSSGRASTSRARDESRKSAKAGRSSSGVVSTRMPCNTAAAVESPEKRKSGPSSGAVPERARPERTEQDSRVDAQRNADQDVGDADGQDQPLPREDEIAPRHQNRKTFGQTREWPRADARARWPSRAGYTSRSIQEPQDIGEVIWKVV